jgi:uncharacterized peroxidase-related enzyme
MSRLSIPTVDTAPEAAKPLLAAVNQQLGVVPNLMKLVAHSPAALEGYLSMNTALSRGALAVGLRERIALAMAQFNGCDYCLSAHDYLGRNVARLDPQDIAAARDFHATEARAAAALTFAQRVAGKQGQVSDADLQAVRDAGFSEAEVIEVVLHVALNVLTNYVNNVAQTDIDFPVVRTRRV